MFTVRRNTSYKNKGFTLIELMVTVAIAGIVLTIGVPSFSQVLKNSRLASNTNSLIASLNLARSEAVKRKVKVFVRRKGSVSQNWDDGWDVFIDLNANEEFDDGTDTLLRTFSSIANGYTLRTEANYGDWIAFLPTGFNDGSGSSIMIHLVCVQLQVILKTLVKFQLIELGEPGFQLEMSRHVHNVFYR